MATYIGQERVICHGSMVEGTQVSLRSGGSTLEFKSRNQGYYALKCINEGMYVLNRYKNFKKFSDGKEPTNTYTFQSTMKVHRIIMGQGDTKYFDTVIIVIHEGNPFYFRPVRQKVKRWFDAFRFVASVLAPHRHTRSSSESGGASTLDRTSQQASPPYSRVERPHRSLKRQSYSADEQEEPAPAHLLPDVIDVGEEGDLRETGSPDEAYEDPYTKRNTRKSIYKKDRGGNYGVIVDINIDETEEHQHDQPDTSVGVSPHRQLCRQKSRSHDDISPSFNFEQLDLTRSPITSPATVGRGGMQPRAERPGVIITRTQSAAAASHWYRGSSHVTTSPPTSPSRKPPPRHIYDRIASDSDDDDSSSDCKQLVSILNREKHRDRVGVELKKDHIAEGLVFVEIDSSIYIATWKKSLSLHGKFQERIHVGDQLLQVNEQQATDMTVIQSAIKSSSIDMVKLWLKRLPKAKVIHLTKNRAQPWGFDCNKNEITQVYEGAQLSSDIDTTSKTKWVITELDHQPVSIQSCGKYEVKHRITGAQTELALVLQPKDFIEKLLRNLRKASIKKKHLTEYIV